MARVTEAKRIEQANEEAALVFFREALSSLQDPRRRQGIRYPLRSVVVIALMAMVCGSDDAEAMDVWAEANAEWLDGILDLPHGTPTQDVFLSVFAALDPEAFRSVFLSWVELLRLGLRVSGKHIAVDGKTSRRSFDTGRNRPAIHTVSAWLSDEGLVLGQIKTKDKSNEITAIPELLRTLDLRGATVTIDAMGCQTEIAKTIVEGEGHYLLAVKENQPALHKDLVATFAEAADNRVRSIDEHPRPSVEVFEQTEKGHGRIETRSIELCRNLEWMMTAERWTGLTFLAKVTRERTVISTNKSSTETASELLTRRAMGRGPVGERVAGPWNERDPCSRKGGLAFRGGVWAILGVCLSSSCPFSPPERPRSPPSWRWIDVTTGLSISMVICLSSRTT